MATSETDPPQPASESQTPPPRSSGGCLKAFVFISLAIIFSFTGLAFYFGKSLKDLVSDPKAFFGAFFTKRVTVDGNDVLLEIRRTHGDILEVASPTTSSESIRKTDTLKIAWGLFYAGTTVTEVRVQATFRFHVKLSEIKDARMQGNVLTITAPKPTPSLPVAIDTATMEKKADSGWARFNSSDQLSEMERSVTAELGERSVKKVEVVREVARKDIEEFVQKWIVGTNPAYRDQIHAIKVVFADEDASRIKTETPLP